ncbi:hypothetical protein AMJ85_05285 [candidate division BRC1 bacterium SM23_51]|nr:MAG: hypothetical protein AMJ85_05285 [candidate division BRC1 bacterium SM23_51]
MANTRHYEKVLGCVVNTVNVGELTSVTVVEDYLRKIQTVRDGLQGPGRHDQAGQMVRVTMVTTDILEMINVLISTPGTMVFYGKESGKTTYAKETITAPLFHALTFNASKAGYAIVSLKAECQFANATDTFDEIVVPLDGQTAPSRTAPERLWRPTTCVYGALEPAHIESFSLTLPGVLLTDDDGGYIGVAVLEKPGYGDPTFTLVIRDSAKQVAGSYDIGTALMQAAALESLVVGFEGVGSVEDQELTLRNAQFLTKQEAHGTDWTGHTLTGALDYLDSDGTTVRTLDAQTPADRLINWAAAA